MAAVGTHEPGLQTSDLSGGTGARLARAVIIVAGSCALVSSLITFVFVLCPAIAFQNTDVLIALFGSSRKKPH